MQGQTAGWSYRVAHGDIESMSGLKMIAQSGPMLLGQWHVVVTVYRHRDGRSKVINTAMSPITGGQGIDVWVVATKTVEVIPP